MQDKIKKYLFDIKQAIEEIESFIKNKTYQDFTAGQLNRDLNRELNRVNRGQRLFILNLKSLIFGF